MGGFVVPLIIRSSSTTVNTLTSMMLRERATNTRAGWRQYFLYTRQKHCTGSGEIQIRPHLADIALHQPSIRVTKELVYGDRCFWFITVR